MTELIKINPSSLTQLDRVAAIVLDTVSRHTAVAYSRALLGNNSPRSTGEEPIGFLPWLADHRTGFNRMGVNSYIAYLKDHGVSPSSANQRLAAIRKLAAEAAANGFLDHAVASAITSIGNLRIEGKKIGNWLTPAQARAMIQAPDLATRKGLRDRAILSVMIGAGLRRSEIVGLTLDHFQRRDGRWVILDIVGKRNKVRTVPVADWIKADIDRWADVAPVQTGPLFG